jgi:hypothetical protein
MISFRFFRLGGDQWKYRPGQRQKFAPAGTRAPHGLLPDDYLELILFVDVFNFEGSAMYGGNGVCFRMAPKRAVLQHFYDALRLEYLAFREQWKVQEKNDATWGGGI